MIFSPDNETLFSVSGGGDIELLDLARRSALSRPVAWDGWGGAFSPDGKLVAIPGLQENDVALVDVATGQILHVLRPVQRFHNYGASIETTGNFRPAFSPDGTQIAVGSGRSDSSPAEIEIFSVATGETVRRLPVPGVRFIGQPLEWSPDGRVIAGAARDQLIRVDAIDGRALSRPGVPAHRLDPSARLRPRRSTVAQRLPRVDGRLRP